MQRLRSDFVNLVNGLLEIGRSTVCKERNDDFTIQIVTFKKCTYDHSRIVPQLEKSTNTTSYFFRFLICVAHPAVTELKDYGILASTDPVAFDQACVDIIFNMVPSDGNDNTALKERITSRHGTHTIDYAEKIGLGNKNINQ